MLYLYVHTTSGEKLPSRDAPRTLSHAAAICIINSNMFSHCAFNMLTVHDINGCTVDAVPACTQGSTTNRHA